MQKVSLFLSHQYFLNLDRNSSTCYINSTTEWCHNGMKGGIIRKQFMNTKPSDIPESSLISKGYVCRSAQ